MIPSCEQTRRSPNLHRADSPRVCSHLPLVSVRCSLGGLERIMPRHQSTRYHAWKNNRCTICKKWKLKTPQRRKADFWGMVDKDAPNGCWLWTGSKDGSRYGQCDPAWGTRLSHRVAFMLVRGFMPEQELDHLCRVRHCVNPDHLEPVTHAENGRRRIAPYCKRRHRQTPANRHTDPRTGKTRCKLCLGRKAMV